MKIYYIGVCTGTPRENPWPGRNWKLTPTLQVIRNTPKPAHELCVVKDLASFNYFQRSTVGEFLTMFSGAVAERTGPASRQDIEEQCTPSLSLLDSAHQLIHTLPP